MLPQEHESFFGKRKKDVFLAGEVAVDGARAVLDLFSNLAHRHVGVPVSQEETARGRQNVPTHRLPLAGMPLFNPHVRSTNYTAFRNLTVLRHARIHILRMPNTDKA